MNNNISYRKLIIPEVILKTMLYARQIHPISNTDFLKALSIIDEIQKKNEIFNRNKNYIYLNIPLSSTYLKKKYGNDYKRIIIDFLVKNQIIWKDYFHSGKCYYFHLFSYQSYIDNIKKIIHFNNIIEEVSPYTYCFQNNIKNKQLTIDTEGIEGDLKNRIFTDYLEILIPLNKKDLKFLKKTYEADACFINNSSNHIKKMGSHFKKNLKIDFDKAKKFIDLQFVEALQKAKDEDEIQEATRKYTYRLTSIANISDGKKRKTLRFSRNETNNRIDTNLTNMAGELRQFIVGSENMAYLDLTNSQPVFFNILLREWKGKNPQLDKEIEEYESYTSKGIWYEHLGSIFRCDRDTGKDNWMLIAYSENKDCKHLKNAFRKVYPELMGVIETYKKKNYEAFSIELQKIESKIFIDKICKSLVESNIIPYTFHDAVMVPKNDMEKTEGIMKNILTQELGWTPRIEPEPLK